MKLVLAQLNPVIGDLDGNANKIFEVCKSIKNNNVDLVITPELSLIGYPPKDLLFNPRLFEEERYILNKLSKKLNHLNNSLSVLVGIAEPTPDIEVPKLYNSVVILGKGSWRVVARKQLLPTYDVFDEKRYFRSAENSSILNLNCKEKDWRIGITICEDIWVEQSLQNEKILGKDPLRSLEKEKLDLLINLSASPFIQSKSLLRQKIAAKAAIRLSCPLIYVNQIGGNDELIFDGSSFTLDREGKLQQELSAFKESVALCDITSLTQKQSISRTDTTSQELLFRALVLGVKDYAKKCNFDSAIIGLSGGIDSALVATIAVAALGISKVHGVLMPSPWSSYGSVEDATTLANRLGIDHQKIPISDLMNSFNDVLSSSTWGPPTGITAENLQSRIRGTILMALANQKKHLLLSTGNKSELAVGYCTLYGDMNGGLSVIGDLYKTSVFKLCNWIDSESSQKCRKDFSLPEKGEVISSEIRNKPPSAELRPEQLDSDSLPDYCILDQILKGLIEHHLPTEVLIEKGFEKKLVNKVVNLLKNAEFKRYQAPPLLKISNQAFGSGWKRPIASG
ncbi:NAD+ synthase [Prochlorococcus marinus]|uniref:Glutamine-dependent NAD(+) synthetase n=1 Tax=Prochlorococcus marinus XMU1408 TaxID=2213228 RepID=A0A318R2F7_PROMR|nr:NAD+ synthase [Prochlorococcus marinus]MBW3042621.1 NAD+ synthase [Prochlorococcus marinus str. XMU1408]PYE01317.1 NAD+ synthase [Prochlorococcus marinus XMU1408]